MDSIVLVDNVLIKKCLTYKNKLIMKKMNILSALASVLESLSVLAESAEQVLKATSCACGTRWGSRRYAS